MKVGFLVATLLMGGAERVIEHLIANLDGDRIRSRVYTLREPGPVGEILMSKGVPLRSGLGPGRPPAPWVPLRLARLFKKDGIQLIYCLDHTNALVVGAVVSLIRGGLPMLMPVHTTGNWGGNSITAPMRLVLRRLSRIISIAETQKRYLVESEGIPGDRISIIRNGIPPLDPRSLPSRPEARERLGIRTDEGPVIGIVAMLRPEKAHENFLSAARQVLETLPRAVFLIAGSGPRQDELQKQARDLGIADQVRFLGLRTDVPEILPAFDLSVLASHPKVETLPLSQMEAMSLGIPVVATRVGALHELIEDGVEGRLVPPGDPQALAEAMVWILGDPERARRAGQAAKERVLAEFSAARMARETEAVIWNAIARSRVGADQ